MKRALAIALVLLAWAGSTAAPPVLPDRSRFADLKARTLILVNSRQPESVALGEFYAEQRGIPRANLIALPLPEAETITWRTFIDQVWQPLQDQLFVHNWLEGVAGESLDAFGRRRVSVIGHRIAYLVVCRGVPLRIDHDPLLLAPAKAARAPEQLRTNQGAVDSELSLLALGAYDINALVPNPLFDRERPPDLNTELIIKVARLDGPTLADARRLVTSALLGEQQGLAGRYYIDLKGPHVDGDHWLEATQQQLDELGFDGDAESTSATFGAAARFDAPALYFGWYAGNLNGPFAREGFVFPPGAIALHIHSASAVTLRSATAGWAGPLVARGVAATVGNVFEPYLQFTHRPDILLRRLIKGATLGDAAYAALPALSWQSLLLGDPLYRPFAVSLDEQAKHLAQLPPLLAPYVAIRESRRLERAGQSDEARAVLQKEFRRAPSLPLALALAQLELRRNDSSAAIAALEFMRALPSYRIEDWPLARLAAQLLAGHGARAPALQIYSALVVSPSPDRDARIALLNEARQTAEAAGDQVRALEFARLASDAFTVPSGERR